MSIFIPDPDLPISVEVRMARRQIAKLIADNPQDVSFQRREKVERPGGGWRWNEGSFLEPQRVTLIPFKRRVTEFMVNTEMGDVPDLPYILLGHHDLDIRRDDIFTIDDQKYQVISLDMMEPAIKTLAQVDYFGGGPNG